MKTCGLFLFLALAVRIIGAEDPDPVAELRQKWAAQDRAAAQARRAEQARESAERLQQQNNAILWNLNAINDRLAAEDAAKEKCEQDENLRRFWAERDKAIEQAAARINVAPAKSDERQAPAISTPLENPGPAILPAASAAAPRLDEVVTFTVPREPDSETLAKKRYVFLMNLSDPRRKLYDAFMISAPASSAKWAALSKQSNWPEIAAEECARLHGWMPATGDFRADFFGIKPANKSAPPPAR